MGLDALLMVTYSPNHSSLHTDYGIAYISNLVDRYENVVFVLTPDDYELYLDKGDLSRARMETWLEKMEEIDVSKITGWLPNPDAYAKGLVTILRKITPRSRIKVGFNGKILRGGIVLALSRQDGIELVDVQNELAKARMVKDQVEIENLRVACKIADSGVEAVMEGTRQGITELELISVAEKAMRENGAQASWYFHGFGWLSFGPAMAEVGYTLPSKRKLRKGDLVTMDLTPVYNGYPGDIGRSFIFGKASPKESDIFEFAEQLLRAEVSSLRGGMKVSRLRDAATKLGTDHHLGKYVTFLGHAMGLYDDQFPFFTSSLDVYEPSQAYDNIVLPVGMALSIEPTLNVKGLGMVVLEDDYLLMPAGAEKLTRAPILKDLT